MFGHRIHKRCNLHYIIIYVSNEFNNLNTLIITL